MHVKCGITCTTQFGESHSNVRLGFHGFRLLHVLSVCSSSSRLPKVETEWETSNGSKYGFCMSYVFLFSLNRWSVWSANRSTIKPLIKQRCRSRRISTIVCLNLGRNFTGLDFPQRYGDICHVWWPYRVIYDDTVDDLSLVGLVFSVTHL